MSSNYPFVKFIRFLCWISLAVLLVGCDSDGGDTSSTVTITPDVVNGIAPLDVIFNVSGANVATSLDWDYGDGDTEGTIGSSPVLHTFDTPGDFIVSVRVGTIGLLSPVPQFEIGITVLPDPASGPSGINPELQDINLIITSFAIDTELTPGSFETVSAIIQNIDSGTLVGSGHIDVGYYLSTDNEITVDDIYIGDTSIAIGDSFTLSDVDFGFELLSPGGNYQYDHPLAVKGNLPAGTYFVGAIVDYIDYYDWYTFPRSSDTLEFEFEVHVVVAETNEEDNVRLLPAHQVTVTAPACIDDAFEPDNSSPTAMAITVGETQMHNFCHDNSDWLRFDAVQGSVYKITTSALAAEADTQLILYDRDGSSILLFNDNILNVPVIIVGCGTLYSVDLVCGTHPNPESEIVWEAQETGTYFIKVRVTTCDEDKDLHCSFSPDGVGLDTGYDVTLQ